MNGGCENNKNRIKQTRLARSSRAKLRAESSSGGSGASEEP
jgi:hypothetical protein